MHEIVISRYMFFEALFVYVLDSTALYSDLQKHESSCLLSDLFCCISPEPFELQKIFLPLLASLFKELSDRKDIFQIGAQIHLILRKTLIFQRKSQLFKKSAILKNSKTFFHASKV